MMMAPLRTKGVYASVPLRIVCQLMRLPSSAVVVSADHRQILATCHLLGYGFMPWSWTGNNHENAWLDMVDSKDWKTPTWWGREVIDGADGIRQTAIRAKVFEDE